MEKLIATTIVLLFLGGISIYAASAKKKSADNLDIEKEIEKKYPGFAYMQIKETDGGYLLVNKEYAVVVYNSGSFLTGIKLKEVAKMKII